MVVRQVFGAMVAAFALAGLVACGPATDTREHQRRAAVSLVKQAGDNGVSLRNATCKPPPSPSVGATLECTAEDSDGVVFNYVLTIAADEGYEVTPKG
jgi:hypothetical protein